MLLQGLVLLIAGIGIVFLFLSLLVWVLTLCSKIIPRFNHILPDEQSKMRVSKALKAKASKPSVSADEEMIAVAMAAAVSHQRR